MTTLANGFNKGDFQMAKTQRGSPDILDDRGVLKDGQSIRLAMMLKDSPAELQKHRRPVYDAATPCPDCGWSGDISIACPTCGKTNGDRADIRAAAAKNTENNMTNHTEAARGGEFGSDRASVFTDSQRRELKNMTDAEKLVMADLAYRQRPEVLSSRPGFRIDHSDAGKAARQKVFDAMSEADEERERAWEELRNMPETVWNENVEVLSGKVPDDIQEQIRAAGTKTDGRTPDQIARDGAAAKEAAYQAYSDAISNSWRNLK
jgi:hypothetical protein